MILRQRNYPPCETLTYLLVKMISQLSVISMNLQFCTTSKFVLLTQNLFIRIAVSTFIANNENLLKGPWVRKWKVLICHHEHKSS